ncbi:MAG: phospholipid carrier-dependent glycosyltransferase [Asticcacaulis sp.]
MILACFNFLRDLDNPPHAFWDESYYLTAAERYQEHRAQYASHPPLAFMFMNLGIDATGSNTHLDTMRWARSRSSTPPITRPTPTISPASGCRRRCRPSSAPCCST